jgi:hypothetical protein
VKPLHQHHPAAEERDLGPFCWSLSAVLEENFARVTTVVTSSISSGSTSSYPTAGDDASRNVNNNAREQAAIILSSQDETTRSSSSFYPLSKPLNASSQQLLYKRIEDHFNSHKTLKLKPQQNMGTCQHRNIVQENNNQSTIEYVACCGLGHRLGRMSAAAILAAKLKAHLYGYWSCCDDVEVFSHLFGKEPIVLYHEQESKEEERSTTTTTASSHSSPIHLQFRNEVAGFGDKVSKCDATDEKISSDFAFYSILRDRYTHKDVVQKFVQQHFTNETLSIAIHIRAGNGETGDFSHKKRQIDDPTAFVRNTVDMIREIVSQNNAQSSTSSSSRPPLSPLVFIATDTRSYVDAFRQELATGTASSSPPIPVVTLPAQVHAEEGQGVMFGVFNKVIQSGEKCLDGWRNVVEDMLVLSHADVVFAPYYSSFTQTIPISLALGRNKYDAHDHAVGETSSSKSHITAPFCDVVIQGEGKQVLSCYETFQQWHCSPHHKGRTVTHQDMSKSWRDVLLPAVVA